MKAFENMKAAVLFKLNSPLKIINLKIPKLQKGQVLVKIFYSAICRSQIMEINSGRDNKKYLPHLLGHEASGKVVGIGKAVKKFKINDNVILTWMRCSGLESENPHFFFRGKRINSGKITTFSNYSVISENRLVKKPKKLKLKESVLFGCSFMTGPGMVFNDLKIKNKNLKIVLVGLGGVGLGIYISLKSVGIKNIILIEKNKNKILLAKKLGIKHCFKSTNNKTLKNIMNIFRGGADICLESAGNVKTIEFAIKLLKDKGYLHFASHPKNQDFIKIKPFDLIIGKKISGSWGGGCFPDRDIKKFSKLTQTKYFKISKIINNEYSLDNINKAINDFTKGKVFRPIIKMQH